MSFFFFCPHHFCQTITRINGRQENEETVYESGGTEDSNKRQQSWSVLIQQQWFRFSNSMARRTYPCWRLLFDLVSDYSLLLDYQLIQTGLFVGLSGLHQYPSTVLSYTSMLLSVCSYIFQHVGQWIVYFFVHIWFHSDHDDKCWPLSTSSAASALTSHPQRGPWTPALSPQPTVIPLGKLLDPILSHGKPVPLDMFLLVLATQLSFSPYSES